MPSTPSSRPKLRWLLLLWGAIIALWAASGYLLFEIDQRGTFGDMFGAVNALFTGLAFATLIYTAWMQREELALQRAELAAARREFSRQADQFEQQSITFELQRFENTFFALLKTHSEIVVTMNLVSANGRATRGRDCFEIYYQRLENSHAKRAMYPDEDALPTIQLIYAEFFKVHQAEIGHYFRHLYHLFKLIATADVPNQRQYASLVRAQLSAYEHLLLFYNCLSIHGIEKFKPLVEQFSLLENMPTELLIDPGRHASLYNPHAYGEASAA